MGPAPLTRRPIVSLVTGRGRLPGTGPDRVSALLNLVAAAVACKVDLIQVREPDLPDAALLDLVVRCVDLARRSDTAILVNDRLDIALAAGASGVHLREHSLPAPAVRPHVPDRFLLGRSVHDAGQALRLADQGDVDYLQFGTVFPSRSKPGVSACGVDPVAAVARAACIPVLAIGGITADNALEVFRAGAAGVAAIGLFAQTGANGRFDTIGHVVDTIRRSYVTPHASRS